MKNKFLLIVGILICFFTTSNCGDDEMENPECDIEEALADLTTSITSNNSVIFEQDTTDLINTVKNEQFEDCFTQIANASKSKVRVEYRPSSAANYQEVAIIDNIDIAALVANNNQQNLLSIFINQPGEYIFSTVTDKTNVVDERDENNNTGELESSTGKAANNKLGQGAKITVKPCNDSHIPNNKPHIQLISNEIIQ